MNPGVQATLLSRVYDVAIETPLERADKLSALHGASIYLKREDLQPVHSFKIRGAYNKIVQLSEEDKTAGVIAASAGNHAQGVALSAQKLGIPALIVMPRTTPDIKVEAVRSYGAEVVLVGDSYTDAFEQCQKLVIETGRTFIHPFDDDLVIAGQGTIGREIIEQLPVASHIFVPIGGGGLIAGIAQYVKNLRPDIQIIGVEPADSNAMQRSVQSDERITLPQVGIFADGVAVKQVGERTFGLVMQYVDEIITVDTDRICAAMKAIFEETRSIVEPAGALGVAGIMHYMARNNADGTSTPKAVAPLDGLSITGMDTTLHMVAICSGANVTFERLQFVAERTLLGSGREALYAVTLPEKPGALQAFCEKVVDGRSITEFNYRLNGRDKAVVLLGIGVTGQADRTSLSRTMTDAGYEHTDLSDDDVTKEHIRHMVGGTAPNATDEHLFSVEFPERPGALGEFLAVLDPSWNISLFHYRGLGGDTGRVLIGFENIDPDSLIRSSAGLPLTIHLIATPGTKAFL